MNRAEVRGPGESARVRMDPKRDRVDRGGPGVSPHIRADRGANRPEPHPVGHRGPDGTGEPALHHHVRGTSGPGSGYNIDQESEDL
eukprot:3450279-Alexandrium_andersonii.AAC.1